MISTPDHLPDARMLFDTEHLKFYGELRFKGELSRAMICDQLEGVQVWSEFVAQKLYENWKDWWEDGDQTYRSKAAIETLMASPPLKSEVITFDINFKDTNQAVLITMPSEADLSCDDVDPVVRINFMDYVISDVKPDKFGYALLPPTEDVTISINNDGKFEANMNSIIRKDE